MSDANVKSNNKQTGRGQSEREKPQVVYVKVKHPVLRAIAILIGLIVLFWIVVGFLGLSLLSSAS